MTPDTTADQPQLSKKKKLLFTLVTLVISLLLPGLLYFSSLFWRASRMYQEPRRWIGTAYQPDPDFGVFPKPNSIAHHSMPFGESVPVAFDRHGFRVPLGESSVSVGTPSILFLGDSFTHGYGVAAEKTFAHLAAQALSSRSLNAGVSGTGLSHMVMRARREVPPFKPSWVVVQDSSWLARRSLRFYQPTQFGKTPLPYFCESDGNVSIHPPVFTAMDFERPHSEYADRSLLPYTWNFGIPLLVHDDYHVALTSIKSWLGILPRPAESRQRVVDYSHKEIERLCQAYGAKMLVVKLYAGLGDMPADTVVTVSSPVVDTLPVLSSRLPEKTEEQWREHYFLRAGDPPRVVDGHPNEEAHRLIAQTIVDEIRAITEPKE